MIAATKSLLLEKGNEDFTLQNVSERGRVSIGSIYLRFESKDRLLHAVIAEELSALVSAEREMLDRLVASSANLEQFLTNYIREYGAFLASQARLLRTIMQRASVDPKVSGPGKETARKSAGMAVDSMLRYADEIRGPDPHDKAEAVFQIIFASIARQYGLGVTPESGDDEVWLVMKDRLATMTLAYLRFDG